MIRSILFHTLLSVLILMGSVGNAFAASSVGEKPDLGVYDFDAATPYPTGVSLSPISLVSGAEIILGPGATTASDGATLFYYWQCWKGTLQAVNGNTAHVRYRAPLTAVNTSDRIRLWVGSTSGKVFRATINVSVTGSVLAPQGGNNFDFGGQPPASSPPLTTPRPPTSRSTTRSAPR